MILLANDLLFDNRVQKEARTLVSAGHDVVVLAKRTPRSVDYEEMDGFRVLRLAPSFKQNLHHQIQKVALSIKADVYHCHDHDTLEIGAFAALENDALLVYDSHEFWESKIDYDFKDNFSRKARLKLREALLMKRASGVITSTASVCEILEKRHGLSNVVVLRNVPEILDEIGVMDLRETFGIPVEKKILVHVGGIMKNRGLEYVVESLQWLQDAVLVFIGEGVNELYKEELFQKATDIGVSHRIYHMTYQPFNRLIQYVASADMGIVYTQNPNLHYYYALPNKLFEYLLAGVPVIASDLPEIKKIVDKYEVGCTVAVGDSKEFAEKVGATLSNPELLAQLKKNTKRAIKENNWQLESRKLIGLYEGLEMKLSQSRAAEKMSLPRASRRRKCGSLLLICRNSSLEEFSARLQQDFEQKKLTVITQCRNGSTGRASVVSSNGFLTLLWKILMNGLIAERFDVALVVYAKRNRSDLLTTIIAALCRANEKIATISDEPSAYDNFDFTFWWRPLRSSRLSTVKSYLKIFSRNL